MSLYRPDRDITPTFLKRVESWINSSGEVFVVLRYLCAAGSKDFAFCRSFAAFRSLCDALPSGTDIVVFRCPQLPQRGQVTEEFVNQVTGAVPDGVEYLIVDLEPDLRGACLLHGQMGITHEDLRQDLNDLLGRSVAAGRCPSFTDGDNDDMISAAKDGIDGPR